RDRYRNFVYRRKSPNVARIQYMSPDQGDVWFLRLLLLHRPANSWTHIRTVDNTIFETYEQTARALGLVHDADEYVLCLQEAARFSTAKELRQLFTTLI
ncbi:unnamed protein product, partial [Laminaria digitata]